MTSAPAWAPLLVTEVALHRRHGVLLAALVTTAGWCALLLALPGHVRPAAVPWVLFVDLTALGFTFAPALSVIERGHGITAALGLTRLTPGRHQLVRVGAFAVLSVLAGAVLLAAGGVGWSEGAGVVLGATALTSALFTLLAIAMVGRQVTLTAYLSRVPLVAAPLLVPALAHGTGLVRSPLLHASPATGALELLHGSWSWTVAAWLLLWILGLAVAVVRIGFDVEPRLMPGAGGRRRQRRTHALGSTGAVRSLLAVDARTFRSDRILLLMLAGLPVIALALRLFSTSGVTWVAQRHGVDLVALLPLIDAFVLVVHIPAMIGSMTGLLFLEDRDAGLLPAIRVTRASLTTLLGYRLGACAVLAGASVALAAAVSGAGLVQTPATFLVTVVVAGATATLPAALLAVHGRDRAHGMALVKLLGLPLYAPLAWWFVDAPVGWLFALSPTGWVARAAWAGSAAEAAGFAVGGVALTCLLAVGVLRRMRPI